MRTLALPTGGLGGRHGGVTRALPEPMLAAPVSDPALLPGWAGEPKWDGFRAMLSVDAGKVVLRSRRGAEMGPAFPETVAGAAQLPDATALDCEAVIYVHGQIDFAPPRRHAPCPPGPRAQSRRRAAHKGGRTDLVRSAWGDGTTATSSPRPELTAH